MTTGEIVVAALLGVVLVLDLIRLKTHFCANAQVDTLGVRGSNEAPATIAKAMARQSHELSLLANRAMNAALVEGQLQINRAMREEQTIEASYQNRDDEPSTVAGGLSAGFSAAPRDGTMMGKRSEMMP